MRFSLEDALHKYGAGVAGAIFGVGWWVWVDAVVTSHAKVPGEQWVPGSIATVALFMINSVRRDSLRVYDPFDDGSDCRIRFWLFLAYVVSFGALVGAVWNLVANYANSDAVHTAAEMWPGVAGVVQSSLVLGAGLLLWLSRAPQYSVYGF